MPETTWATYHRWKVNIKMDFGKKYDVKTVDLMAQTRNSGSLFVSRRLVKRSFGKQ
jgi:hypothetical protein